MSTQTEPVIDVCSLDVSIQTEEYICDWKNSVNSTEISVQTEDCKCVMCEENITKVKYMETLEKEFQLLKEEHSRLKVVHLNQSEEMNSVRERDETISTENLNLKSELDKVKKSCGKLEKQHELEIKEIKNELQRAYFKADAYIQEN